MTNAPNQPWSFASPWGSGMIPATVVNINSADNSVQVRVSGYQDDTGNIPDSDLQWVKVLGHHSGIAGATATHPYYVGSKVMVSMSGPQMFIVGSVTGYDSDQSNQTQGADNSDNKNPNTPNQVKGTQGPDNRQVPSGQSADDTSKGTRNVTQTDKPYQAPSPQKIFDYAKQLAPFDKGQMSKFPTLQSIGILKLLQGSNVLDTIDGMDGNASGAIQASTKIIRMIEQGGFGSALSLIGGNGGPADQATAQVAQTFGNLQLADLLAALLALLAAYNLVQSLNAQSTVPDLSTVTPSLQYSTFDVAQAAIDQVQTDVTAIGSAQGAALTSSIAQLKSDFGGAFNQAVANAVAYVASMVNQYGIAVLVTGTTSTDQLTQLIGAMQSAASAAGMPASTVNSLAGGQFGQVAQGTVSVQSILQQVQGQVQQLQQVAGLINTFSSNQFAMGEIMGGGSSTQESMTGIVMKYINKPSNQDGRGFTK